jgi:hypothetical protein
MTFWRLAAVLTILSTVAAPGSGARSASSDTALEFRRVPNGGIQPEVVLDAAGEMHMVYFAGDPAAGDLFYVRSQDAGATFTPPVRINSQAGSAIATGTIRGGQLALGRDNRLHVVWNGSHKALPQGPTHRETGRPGMPLLYSRSMPSGKSFEPQRNLMRRTWALDGGASVAADASGNVSVAWHAQSGDESAGDEGARRLWVARSANDGQTFETERPVWDRSTGACACCGVRAFSASTGTLFVLYRSAREQVHRDVHLLTSNDGARSFAGTAIDPWKIAACPMTSMSFAESAGRVFAAWETAGDVRFGTVNGNTPPTPIAPSAAAATGRKHPRLAVSNREVLLVWAEGTAWARGGSVGWQRFDLSGRPVGNPELRSALPTWSFAAAIAHSGGFTIFY